MHVQASKKEIERVNSEAREKLARERLTELAITSFASMLSGCAWVKYDPKSRCTFAYFHREYTVSEDGEVSNPIPQYIKVFNEGGGHWLTIKPALRQDEDHFQDTEESLEHRSVLALKFVIDSIARGEYLER